ncbi:hypothetical protein B0T16DRAFT_412418 [Cercophora newfieldiana]|uniref:F-box domain-containing protein n=1 Tax=Cercophora newfieldiana TaxID=92897 RepID=A0AA39Y5C0_9PEZI|nr:hypothetical protein B0T16DRAFT_412418 [Cercophora newfieldiana]
MMDPPVNFQTEAALTADRLLPLLRRKLHILDLPDELLLGIFEIVEDFEFELPKHPDTSSISYRPDGRRDIQHTRLVCRRFCSLSSQLLVRLVCVGFDKDSLSRLDAISRHPTIAKGVRSVRIILHFYSHTLTEFTEFANFLKRELLSQAAMSRSYVKMEFPPLSISKQPAKTMYKAAVELVDQVGLAVDPQQTPKHRQQQAALRKIHREYQMRYEEQEELLNTGVFGRAVGAALSRMPLARKLYFQDTFINSRTNPKVMKLMVAGDPKQLGLALRHLASRPATLDNVLRHHLQVPNYRCVFDVIKAVVDAGVLLESIRISMSQMAFHGCSPFPTPDVRREFSLRLRCLKEFELVCGPLLWSPGQEVFLDFCSACLDTPSLQRIKLRGVDDSQHDGLNAGRILGSRSRERLSILHLQGVDIDLSTLVALARSPQPMSTLHLIMVSLRTGTWKEALDFLRAMEGWKKRLKSPRGIEIDQMTKWQYREVFASIGPYMSNAETFINRAAASERNPIDAVEDSVFYDMPEHESIFPMDESEDEPMDESEDEEDDMLEYEHDLYRYEDPSEEEEDVWS